MLKLCIIANPNSIHTVRWVEYLVECGYEIHLIGEHLGLQPVPNKAIFYDLPKLINTRKLRYLVWALNVRYILRRVKPKILHALGAGSAGWLGMASGFHPFIVTALGSDLLLLPKKSNVQKYLTLRALNDADHVICVSEHIARKATQYGIRSDKIDIIRSSIDTDIFNPKTNSKAIRSKHHLGPGPIVVSIRAMNYIYNPITIAYAIPKVLKIIPDSQFLIFTYNCDEDLLHHFKSIINQMNVDHAITYIDPISDDNEIAEYFRSANVAISVPSSDGNPVSVLESMACGAALVLSDLPSLHEWAENEQEALFVPVGDVDSLSNAIVRLLSNTQLRKKIATNAATKIRQHADMNVWMPQIEDIYLKNID